MMYIRLPNTLLCHVFMEKDLKSKFSKIFSEQKQQKEAFLRGKGGMMQERRSLQTTAPDSYLIIFKTSDSQYIVLHPTVFYSPS